MNPQDYDENMALGYNDLPNAKERMSMSVLALAEEISKRKKDSPSYIVLSHELNLKLAREQARATLNAGWISAAATLIVPILTFVIGIFIGSSQQEKETNQDSISMRSKHAITEAIGNKTPPKPMAISSQTVDKPSIKDTANQSTDGKIKP